jgi:hypothetical protein
LVVRTRGRHRPTKTNTAMFRHVRAALAKWRRRSSASSANPKIHSETEDTPQPATTAALTAAEALDAAFEALAESDNDITPDIIALINLVHEEEAARHMQAYDECVFFIDACSLDVACGSPRCDSIASNDSIPLAQTPRSLACSNLSLASLTLDSSTNDGFEMQDDPIVIGSHDEYAAAVQSGKRKMVSRRLSCRLERAAHQPHPIARSRSLSYIGTLRV